MYSPEKYVFAKKLVNFFNLRHPLESGLFRFFYKFIKLSLNQHKNCAGQIVAKVIFDNRSWIRSANLVVGSFKNIKDISLQRMFGHNLLFSKVKRLLYY